MTPDALTAALYERILQIPLIDPHTHIDPHRPAARSVDDILGYHYYTELAHSAGMDKAPLDPAVPPRERVRAIVAHMARYDNTVQHQWFLEIARTFLGFEGQRLQASDADRLFDEAERRMARPGWEEHVLRTANLEKVFLTNDFDDPLAGWDTKRYVPCLRTDDLVFRLHEGAVRKRLTKVTNVEIRDPSSLRKAVTALFEHFTKNNARACAISLPPDFAPLPVDDAALAAAFRDANVAAAVRDPNIAAAICNPGAATALARGVFWMLAEHCHEYRLPFDLMIGVNRRVYAGGVFQGQDLFDGRLSLAQYAGLFNAFPSVPFCVSVLSSRLNEELVAYSWIFPNVLTSGHWWYQNLPAFIERDLRARLEGVPKTKQIGYYSDMYKLEFALPKYNMYRRALARLLAEEYLRPGRLSEDGAVDLARQLLYENVRRVFGV
jgi:glucuronate isomerase